jgi:putative transcriptional regulator
MVRIKLNELLEKNHKTLYWLSKASDIRYHNLAKLANAETNAIRFEVLEKICLALKCDITDILELDKENNKEQE